VLDPEVVEVVDAFGTPGDAGDAAPVLCLLSTILMLDLIAK
jgi:hypothetical protein